MQAIKTECYAQQLLDPHKPIPCLRFDRRWDGVKLLRALIAAAVLSLGLSVSPSSIAQTDPSPQALEAARALTSVISVSMTSEFITNMTNQVWPNLEAAIRSRNPATSATTLAELRRDIERQQMGVILESMNDTAVIYARHFTIQEMNEMAAFYQTPTGRKALLVMPRLMTEFVTAMAPRLQMLETRVGQTIFKMLQ